MSNLLQKAFMVIMTITMMSPAWASESLSYSGRLVNTNGSPVVGPVDLKFDLANTADTSVILCTQTINSVALTNGVFHVKLELGCGAPTLTQVLSGIVSPDTAAIRVTNLSASKVYSFQELHSVPTAQVAHGLSKLNANNNEVLTWTGSKWEPKPVTGATGGTVTSIVAGSGLSGGTITNSGTIAIANSGVTDSHLAGNIDRSKLASGAANAVVVNNGAGLMSEVPQLPVSSGGTGSNTAAGARTNLGLGSAALVTFGSNWQGVLEAALPTCQSWERLTVTSLPIVTLTCVSDISTDATKLPLSGGTMSGAIAMGNNKITDLATPTAGTDAATMAYVDSKVLAAPGDNLGNHTATTNLALGSNNITGVNKIFIADGAWNSPSISFSNSSNTGFYQNGGIIGFSANGSLAMNLSSSTLILNGSYAPYMRLGGGTNGASGPTYSFGGDSDTGIFNLSPNILGFSTGGAEKMRILATGEVAIGKTTAAEKLDVAGSIALDTALRLKSDTANYVDLRAPAGLVGGLSLVFPPTAGSAGQALVTNGAGVLSWSPIATTASAVGGDISGTIANAQLVADSVGTSEIANGSVTYAKLNLTDGDLPLAKLAGASDATKYLKGDKSWGTFLTDVLAAPFATVTPSNTAIANADSLQVVVNKTQGQINALKSADTNFLVKNGTDTISGTVSVSGALKIPSTPSGVDLTDAANVQYVQNYVGTFGQWLKNGSNLYYDSGAVSVGTNTITGPNSIETKMKILRPVNKWGLTIEGEGMNQADIMLMAPGSSANNRVGQIVNTIDKMMFRSINDDATVKNTLISMLHTSGYVGIGTHTPLRPMHVAQTAAAGGNTAPVMIERVNTSGTPAANELTMMQFKMPNSSGTGVIGADMGATLTDVTPGSEKGALIFRTSADGGSTIPERMRIESNGDIGIGTTTPTSKLHVVKAFNGLSNVNAAFISATDGGITNTGVQFLAKDAVGLTSNGSFLLNAILNGTSFFNVTGAGNVGIGTTTPGAKLDVANSATFQGNGTGANTYFRTTNSTNQDYMAFGWLGEDTWGIMSADASTHRNLVLQGYGGNVGIGTTTPTYKLDVNGSIRFGGAKGTLSYYNSGGYDQAEFSAVGATTNLSLVTNGISRLNITPTTGFIGIHNANPAYTLDVSGDLRITGTPYRNGGDVGWVVPSDSRLKDVTGKYEYGLQEIANLETIKFRYKKGNKKSISSEEEYTGVIAQEVQKQIPDAVKKEKDGFFSLNTTPIFWAMVNSIKELFSESKELKREIASLKEENEVLKKQNLMFEKRLNALEQKEAKKKGP